MNSWNVGHAQHGFGDRPEEQPLEPGSAVRRHRDQPAVSSRAAAMISCGASPERTA
jgi:hypothetical protein